MKDFDHLPRVDRRVALKWISSASLSLPFLSDTVLSAEGDKVVSPSGTGYGPDPDLIKSYQPGDLWPLIFSDVQRQLVITLCDIIIPGDEQSPSASSLGVHDFINEWISSPYPRQARDRKLIMKGLTWLDGEAMTREGAIFASLPSQSQIAICSELAKAAKSDSKKYPGSFFLRLRDLVAGAYYTTPEGMKDIGYRGNLAMAEWNGPPPGVLKKLGLSAQ